ncbi:MAG TPA: hypothetical protein VH113_03135, partial [Gemmatimonadales bacterium]|nr:hypothetical protein [Gemmatimonadales bacterium]
MADADSPGSLLPLEEVQALGSVEEALTDVISDSRSRDNDMERLVPVKEGRTSMEMAATQSE